MGMDSTERAMLVARRFEEELGYGKALPYSIHNRRRQGRVMYHMIHATDHTEAPALMIRAYRNVTGRRELGAEAQQRHLDELWGDLQDDEISPSND